MRALIGRLWRRITGQELREASERYAEWQLDQKAIRADVMRWAAGTLDHGQLAELSTIFSGSRTSIVGNGSRRSAGSHSDPNWDTHTRFDK